MWLTAWRLSKIFTFTSCGRKKWKKNVILVYHTLVMPCAVRSAKETQKVATSESLCLYFLRLMLLLLPFLYLNLYFTVLMMDEATDTLIMPSMLSVVALYACTSYNLNILHVFFPYVQCTHTGSILNFRQDNTTPDRRDI